LLVYGDIAIPYLNRKSGNLNRKSGNPQVCLYITCLLVNGDIAIPYLNRKSGIPQVPAPGNPL